MVMECKSDDPAATEPLAPQQPAPTTPLQPSIEYHRHHHQQQQQPHHQQNHHEHRQPQPQPQQHHHCNCPLLSGNPYADDDPPPYASLVQPQDHVSWPYVVYPGGAGPSAPIVRPFVTIPLTSYRIFKIESPDRSGGTLGAGTATTSQTLKSGLGIARKYGGVIIAGSVILFLMLVSILVHFVVQRWKH